MSVDDLDPQYIAKNRRIAQRLLILLQRRRLFRNRFSDEDQQFCRKSAADLSKVLEAEMLTIEDGGYLLQMLTELQRACVNFVSAAGAKAVNFRDDGELFRYHLNVLREVFAQRVGRIVDAFGLPVTPEIQDLIDFRA